MRGTRVLVLALSVLWLGALLAAALRAADDDKPQSKHDESVQLGPRPFFLVNDMRDGPLRSELLSCSDAPFTKTDFSIGHRGAALQFPEHTREAYEAGARMGAG